MKSETTNTTDFST